MALPDRDRWDARYLAQSSKTIRLPGPPGAFAHVQEMFPTSGSALEVACGSGAASVWLAQRGLHVTSCDVSPVAIDQARQLAAAHNVASRCTFLVADLDDGLPAGEPVDLLLCHMFREPELDPFLIDRVAVAGTLAIACLSEIDAAPGRFRATPGSLLQAFGELDVKEQGEASGVAWLVATK